MLNNADTVGSADWYLLRLGKALTSDLQKLNDLQRYDKGDHPLPVGNANIREMYRKYQHMARSNYCGLVTSTVTERMSVTGFFTGGSTRPVVDSNAWKIWQANALDAESAVCHRQMVALGRSYVIIGPPDPNDPETPDTPIITVEHPCSVIHEPDPCRPRRVRAAVKTYFDPTRNVQLAIVYLPNSIAYYQAVKAGVPSTEWVAKAWQPDTTDSPDGVTSNTLGIVPVVPFINRRDVDPMGFSEFGDVTDVQDRINVTVLDRLVIQAMQAFRQRWVIGLDTEDENGNPQKPFDPGADMIWSVPNDNDGNQGVKFGDFDQSDVSGIISACESDIAILGNLSRTPPHYLTGQLVNVSGDALTVAESGLVSKTRNRHLEAGESWERVVRIAGMYVGVPVDEDAVIVWVSPERRALASLADAAVKWENTGVPFRERMALLEFTPAEIDRMEQERIADSLLSQLNNPLGVDPGSGAATTNVAYPVDGAAPPPPGAPAVAAPPAPAPPAPAKA